MAPDLRFTVSPTCALLMIAVSSVMGNLATFSVPHKINTSAPFLARLIITSTPARLLVQLYFSCLNRSRLMHPDNMMASTDSNRPAGRIRIAEQASLAIFSLLLSALLIFSFGAFLFQLHYLYQPCLNSCISVDICFSLSFYGIFRGGVSFCYLRAGLWLATLSSSATITSAPEAGSPETYSLSCLSCSDIFRTMFQLQTVLFRA